LSGVQVGGVPACPNCGGIDQVAFVPDVFCAGLRQVRVHVLDPQGPLYGPGHDELRTVPTQLAAALAPAPAPTGTGDVLGVVFVATVLVLGGLAAVLTGELSHSVAMWVVVSVAFLLAIVVVTFGARSHRRAALEHGARRARSKQVWQQGWYCSWCGTVHFGADQRTGPSRAMALGEFRRLVWGAGGFALPGAFHPSGHPIK
jgi:hypothetical protein